MSLWVALVAPSLDVPGGHAVQARALAEGLRREGRRVTLVPVNQPFPAGVRWLRPYPYIRSVPNEVLYVAALRHLRHADVVHVFAASYWSFLVAAVPAILAARALGKRTVLHYHSGEAEDHLVHWGWRVHPWLRRVHEIVVPSAYLRDVFARFGYRARVIPNVVDTSCFRYRERVSLGPRLLSNRNFEPHYRVDDTLEAFALVRAQYPDATLTVAGSGSQEPRLRRLATSLGGAVRFLGRVEPRDMPRLYDEADFFLNASVVDNQPVSILEAFAAGLPVVSTPTGDIGAMLGGGERGFLVEPDDPAGLAKTVVSLLEHPDRVLPVVRRALGEIERYTWAQVRRAWARVHEGMSADDVDEGERPC
jgi:glycosyltransferase involved in cell wall biosynthesis